jgi:DNA primase
MDSAVEEIKSRINIVDFIGGYVQLQKAGANWRARCPFHNEKTPSFMVNEEKQIFHCFGCGKGGDLFRFIMEMDGLEFKEALKILADRAGVKLETRGRENTADKKTLFDILELSVKFYEKQLWDGAGKVKILKYLRDRGLKDETIKAFRIGYAPAGWRNALTFLIGRGYKPEDIIKTGLLVLNSKSEILPPGRDPAKAVTNPKQIPNSNDLNSKQDSHSISYKLKATSYYDRFRDRITFPIFDVMGKPVGFSARVAPGGDESQAKYVNTPESSVYSKSFVLYGIDKAKREMKEKDFALLVEGNLDVIASHQAGLKNTIAVSGTALTSQQLDIIKRYTSNIKMFFDMDDAGKNALRRSAELCFEKDLNAYVVTTQAGKDAAEIVAKDPAILMKAVKDAESAMQYFIEEEKKRVDLNQPANKKGVVKKLLEILGYFSNPVEKDLWIRKIADSFEVDEKAVRDSVKTKIQKNSSYQRQPAAEEKLEMEESRSDKIIEKVINLMILHPRIWKKITADSDNKLVIHMKKNLLFSRLMEMGEKISFDSKNLAANSDPELEKIASRLAFQQSMKLAESVPVEEAENQLEKYLYELQKEIAKSQLAKIAQDLKKAEISGDKEAVRMLISDFNRICSELR